MSKCWYPIIDYNRCCECGKCVKKYRQGVYDKSKMPDVKRRETNFNGKL